MIMANLERLRSAGKFTKTCTRCREEKPFDGFYVNGNRLQSVCKKCWRETRKPIHPSRNREYNYKRLYGISADQVDSLFDEQCGVCALCGEVPKTKFVDHDHVTGKVRGVLCYLCNTGLGAFRDDPTRLRYAIKYLEKIR